MMLEGSVAKDFSETENLPQPTYLWVPCSKSYKLTRSEFYSYHHSLTHFDNISGFTLYRKQ